MWAGEKLLTPIEVTRPSSRRRTRARQVSTYRSALGIGQWIRYRSNRSRPRRSALASNARRVSSKPWSSFHTLVVTKTSSRATPEARSPSPTSRSLPYSAAVSTCR